MIEVLAIIGIVGLIFVVALAVDIYYRREREWGENE